MNAPTATEALRDGLRVATTPSGGAHGVAIAIIWLVTAVLIAATWVHVQALVVEGRAQEVASAERDLSNLTRLSQEHASRTLRSADQVIRFVRARYLEIGRALDLADLTAKGVIDTEIFNQVGIIDEHGQYAMSNLPFKGSMDLSDREHFRVHREADTGTLFVSKPVLGRASGKWSIQLTRRISRANGDFAGVVVLSIDPGYFTRFYNELNLGSQGLAALYGLDGVARARKVGQKEEFGSNAAGGQMFAMIQQGQQAGSYQQASVVDGVKRIFHYRKVPQYDLVVVAAWDMQELFAQQQAAARALREQAGVLSLMIVALAVALTRYLTQIRRGMRLRQAAELQIQDRTDQLNAIFALSPDGFVSFDRDIRIKYVSPAFGHMVGRDTGVLTGMDADAFSEWLAAQCTPGSHRLDVTALRQKVVGTGPNAQELIDVNGNGKRTLKVGLRCSDSSSVSQILYFRDVTHETEVDHMKSEFLSTAAHELRTPMASILGFSEILLDSQVDTQAQREFLGIIYKQSQLMTKILDELLDLARIESRGGKDFRYSRVCLQDLIQDLVTAYIPPDGRHPPQLTLPQEQIVVSADAGKLRQAILNVLSNAFKYSPAGGPVGLSVQVHHTPGTPARALIEVVDQGMGMLPEQSSRVCERFYRADTSGKTAGTGLGMSIVKEIIDIHGGDLSIESALGQGTRIGISLPL